MNRPTSMTLPSKSPAVFSENYEKSRRLIDYVSRAQATTATYTALGFKSGLEIHQQLLTKRKLFCHCPAGVYQRSEYDAEVVRHMRPTLSEMGEYDGTALMEKKTRKTIVYRIKNETACTYDIDDTPPFKIDRTALDIALEIALMLDCNIIGELHITRKQYLDGSIPTGFQRTAIVGIEGEIPLACKRIRIIQLSLEEDSCREVSDIGHTRVFTTDRLGIPLIETVTYPEMLTPDEVAEAAHYLRWLVRSSGKVRTGLGAARQDVNVSINDGTRVEIKGVARIKWIPELTHNEAFRQKALLQIRVELNRQVAEADRWEITSIEMEWDQFHSWKDGIVPGASPDHRLIAVNLPGFKNILSFFTQPGRCFADEISDRLKVIACLEKPNMAHSEGSIWLDEPDTALVRNSLGAGDTDAQMLLWGPADDIATALETVEERCRLAFLGVPNETRKSLPDGTTIFERVLPGPDRMYPDTDSAPISIETEQIERLRPRLVQRLPGGLAKLRAWKVPADAFNYLIRHDLIPLVDEASQQTGWPEKFVALLLAHTLRGLERKQAVSNRFELSMVAELCRFLSDAGCDRRLAPELLPRLCANPTESMASIVGRANRGSMTLDTASKKVSELVREYQKVGTSQLPESRFRWIMGRLRPQVEASVDLSRLAASVRKVLANA